MQSQVSHELGIRLDFALPKFSVLDDPSRQRSVIHQINARVMNRFHRREVEREFEISFTLAVFNTRIGSLEGEEEGGTSGEGVRTRINSDFVNHAGSLSFSVQSENALI
jgi:hypothetical protein